MKIFDFKEEIMKKRILFLIVAMLTVALLFSACGKKDEQQSSGEPDTNTSTTTDTSTNTDTTTDTSTDTTVGTDTSTDTGSGTTTDTATDTSTDTNTDQPTPPPADGECEHDMQFVETIKPTCQEGGWDTYACTKCGETEKRHETKPSWAPDAHTYEEIVVLPTCTTAGSKAIKCSLCNTSLGDIEILPKLNHTYERADFDGVTGVEIVSPTCEANGKIIYTCQEPGCDSYNGSAQVLEKQYEDLVAEGAADADNYKALGHNFEPAQDNSNLVSEKMPDCETSGSITYACQNGCGEVEEKAEGYEPLGHTYQRDPDNTKWTYDYYSDADRETCINTGIKWVKCTDCGHSTHDDEKPNQVRYAIITEATGEHTFDFTDKSTAFAPVAPTCTEAGYTEYKCTADAGCNERKKNDAEAVAPTGHDWELKAEDLDENNKPTCKTEGNWNYVCKTCGVEEYNVNDDVPLEIKHTGYTIGEYSKAATCISRAKYLCDDCGREFVSYVDEADPNANPTGIHTYNKKGETTASTCSAYGYTTYHCDNDDGCEETERRDYTALAAHNYSEPTEDGTIKCSACHKSLRDITTDVQETTKTLCTCGTGETCTECKLKVEFIATKVPESANAITANETFTKDGFADDKRPALLVLKGEAGTEYTITVYDSENNAITTYDIIVDGVDVGDANVVTKVSGAVAYVNLEEIADTIYKVTVTATTNATVQMYCEF